MAVGALVKHGTKVENHHCPMGKPSKMVVFPLLLYSGQVSVDKNIRHQAGKSLWTKGSGWADDLRRFADEELIPDKDCEVLRYPGPLKPTQRLEVTAPQAARDHEKGARICCVRVVQIL